MTADPAAHQLFDELAAEYLGRPGIFYGRIWHNEGLKINSKVFAVIVRGALVVKIPAADAARLIEGGQGVAFEPRPGRPAKEWVVVESADRARWRQLIADAFDYGTELTEAPASPQAKAASRTTGTAALGGRSRHGA